MLRHKPISRYVLTTRSAHCVTESNVRHCTYSKPATARLRRCGIICNIEYVRRSFSDRAMGYSPMAQPTPATTFHNPHILNPNSREIPTAKDVEIVGNIFAPHSAKRDKLAELKVEAMANEIGTLDDAATAEQKLDLWLVDGLAAISDQVDTDRIVKKSDTITNETNECKKEYVVLHELFDYCKQKTMENSDLNQIEWEKYLMDVKQQVDRALTTLPSDRCLRDVRDFYNPSKAVLNDHDKALLDKFDSQQMKNNKKINASFQDAVIRFRLLQTKEAMQQLQKGWKDIMVITDQDTDRAAVQGRTVDEPKTIPATKLQAVLHSYLLGNCVDRVDSLWSLVDKDNDGLLDEEEMVKIAYMAIEPVGQAVLTVLQESLQAYPVRAPLPEIMGDSESNLERPPVHPSNMGWRQRRQEKKAKLRLLKLYQNTLKTHFLSEVELAHRLRCSYAWANKEHQDNRIDSVLVDETGWSGRKRYVELKPKIALPEFREVQAEHIKHLDQIASEYVKSFRESLLVHQGKGRQNKELLRDCFLFMVGICTVDYIIAIM